MLHESLGVTKGLYQLICQALLLFALAQRACLLLLFVSIPWFWHVPSFPSLTILAYLPLDFKDLDIMVCKK